MSNVGRPRKGFKACPYCGSTSRDSNGQCHCRNVLYRLISKAPQQKARIVKAFNAALEGGESIEGAANVTRAKVPATGKVQKKVAPKPKPTPAPKEKTEPARYILTIDDFEEKKYARKDAAIKNGVRSGMEWTVTYKGKVVATSEV